MALSGSQITSHEGIAPHLAYPGFTAKAEAEGGTGAFNAHQGFIGKNIGRVGRLGSILVSTVLSLLYSAPI